MAGHRDPKAEGPPTPVLLTACRAGRPRRRARRAVFAAAASSPAEQARVLSAVAVRPRLSGGLRGLLHARSTKDVEWAYAQSTEQDRAILGSTQAGSYFKG